MVCIFQGQTQKSYIIPGREIPKWFEEVNKWDTLVDPRRYSNMIPVAIKKVKLQLPLVGDDRRRVVLCVLFLPIERHHRHQLDRLINVDGCLMSYSTYGRGDEIWLKFTSESLGEVTCTYCLSEYGKVESHHLWLGEIQFYLPETPGCSIGKNGFHQVELEIETQGMVVEKIGFRVL